jgi:hypothetical protein
MSRTAYSGLLYWAVLYLPFRCFAQTDNVKDYALFCYGEIGVTAADLVNSMGTLGTMCSYGIELSTSHEGIGLYDIPLGDPRRRSANFLNTCDTPAWLGSGQANSQCYGRSFITPLSVSSTRGSVKGALLCRHKTKDPGLDARGFPEDDDYDDIAMILHNEDSGKTCWFQTKNGPGVKRGPRVPPPHLDTTGFWLPPSETSNIQCAKCHDNGPWMNSQWLYSAYQGFKDGFGKYETPEYGTIAFHAGSAPGNWPPTNDFVTVGRTGLPRTPWLPECTSCHRLSARILWPGNSTGGGGGHNGTFERWFEWSTGRKSVPQATVTEPGRASIPGDYLFTHWMPTYYERHPPQPIEARRPRDPATYNTLYAAHLDALMACMQADRAFRALKPGEANKPPNCETETVMLNSAPAPAGTGAMVSATVLQTSRNLTASAAPAGTASDPIPEVVAVGHSLRLGWQAEAKFKACKIEATTPPGVLVPATDGSVTSLIGSGKNWGLPQTPPVVGPLTEPGIYDFSIYCDDTYTASLQFQVGTTGPHSMVELVTSVHYTVQATAVHSQSLMQPSTTTNVQSTDSVELTWIAYNVRPGSCFLSGPGVTSNDEVGSHVITVSGAIDQTFTFQCTGANDGTVRTVSSTLHPVPSSCSYSIAPATVSLPVAGGTGSITVTAAPACIWAVSGTPGWITITSGGNGSGNGTIVYSVQANTGDSRTGTLTIAGQTFTVTQTAQANEPVSATLSSSVPPTGKPDPMSPLAGLSITISGGTAGQRMNANVAVYLNTNLAVVPDTALLVDASGATISAAKTANAYSFFNVQFEQPGAGATRVYTIKNMMANTASIPMPATGPAQVIAMVAITGAVPLPLSNPSQIVGLVSRNVAPTADSVTPGSGRGARQVFQLAYSDGNGHMDLVSVSVLFTSNEHQQRRCRVDYDRANNALYLGSDAGPVRGPIIPGSAGSLQNSRCELNAAGSSVTGSGSTLTLNLALAFRPAFAGQSTILMEASDGMLTSGLQTRGTWVVP